jgi:ankyrin repeat protein
MLRNCLPQNVRRVLQELPASLDETYERMLREILKANPDQTFRLLQCLTVATRPLRVDELAEVLTLDFDTAEEGIPALNKDWRWDDERQGVLATCSSLIVVVDSYDYNSWRKIRLVQFAHFSVKEFLTSDRLAGIKADISRFHIRLEPAHTVITQACLGVLLQSDYDDRVKSSSSLSKYAARYWVGHAQFENVSSHIEGGMRRLFDPAKRHFIAWLDSYNLDNKWVSFLEGDLHSSTSWHPNSASFGQEDTAPCLYYAALCGFYDLTKYLIFKNPLHVNARVGLNKSSLVAALHNRHFRVVELLYQHGAVLPIGYEGRTLLHAASADGRVDVAQWLLNIGVDANAQDDGHRTPLHFAAANGHPELVQILLGHSVDVNARDWSHRTPLHLASKSFRGEESVRLLIEHGASVNARDGNHQMPLHLASSKGHFGTVQLLIENGAHVNARDWRHQTPLYLALFECAGKTARLLIKHGAGIHALSLNRSTALHLASSQGDTETVWLLIKHGADVDAQDHDQSTPLHKASSLPFWINAETIVRLLIEHGASVDAYDKNHQTPLHRVSSCDYPNSDSLRLLLENGADADVEDDKGSTPFQMASSKENWSREHRDIVQLLLDHSARVVSNSM